MLQSYRGLRETERHKERFVKELGIMKNKFLGIQGNVAKL